MNIREKNSLGILCGLVASVCTGAGLDKRKQQENILFCQFENQGAHHYSKDRPPRPLR